MRALFFASFVATVGCSSPQAAPAQTPAARTESAQPAPPSGDAQGDAGAGVTAAATGDAGATPAAGEARARYEAALAAAERGDFAAAARGFEEAHALRPSVELAFNAGRMYERQADVANAARWYERVLAGNPDPTLRADVTARLASVRDYERRRREGFAAPPPGQDAMAREAATWFARGTALYQRRRFADALRAFEAANQYAQDRIPELMFNLAVTHERLGHDRDAVGAFRAYLSARPDSPDRADIEGRIRRLQP